MALANYTDLQASIAGWLNRQDLTARIPDFVALAEADFNRTLRVAAMVQRTTLSVASGTSLVALPAGWQEAIGLTVTGNGRTRKIEYLTPSDLDDVRGNYLTQLTTLPDVLTAYYNLVGGSQLELVPTPTANITIQMIYYGSIPSLATNATNWLMTAHPDAYLYGSLLHSAPYLDDDGRVVIWQAGYQRAMDAITMADEKAKHSGGPLKRRFTTFGGEKPRARIYV